MNFLKQLFTNSDNPAVAKQNKYKKMAKKRGLMSFNESLEAIKEGNDIRGSKFYAEENSFVIETGFLTEASKKQTSQKFENKTLFSPNNFNQHYIGEEDMKTMVEEFNNCGVDDVCNTLNIDHSQAIQDQLGFFSNIKYDEETNTIVGDVEITRFNNSKLMDMLAVLDESSDIQLGLSIEFTADDWKIEDGVFAYTSTHLQGLALTLTPSAPQTLMSNTTTPTQPVINEALEAITAIFETEKTALIAEKTALIAEKTALEVEKETLLSQQKELQTENASILEMVTKLTEALQKQNEKIKGFETFKKNSLKANI
jgi:hypothetical protein